ncbi:ATP-binding protein [Marasmitruncus massiliensis]|uniref:ATP-binding protein n=1 Tax=Marasmitruncus massiliensis TaxID=1944642 RepID=UPI000C7A9B56|nr:ATP-binding protein [Marasmitruncus massiliensis]
MKRVYGTIYVKVVAIMLAVIFISVVVPYSVFNLYYKKYAGDEIEYFFIQNLKTATRYLEEHDLPLNDMEHLYNVGTFRVLVQQDTKGLTLTPEQEKMLENEEEPVITNWQGEKGVYAAAARYRDVYVIWILQTDSLFQKTHFAGMLALLVSVLGGSFIAVVAGRKMTGPIRKLNDATRRVAAGEFSLQLKNPYRDEIGSLINSFNIMTRELASVEMLRSDFVSDISHEFKTPLTAIEGYAKLLVDETDPDERRGYVQIITEETQRLSTLAQNILTLNKLEKGNIPVQRSRVCIDEQIRRALTLCESKWSAKLLELELELDEAEIEGLEPLLMQVWTNLIDNAIKFSAEGKKIWITLVNADRHTIFRIQDEGPGIPEIDRNHIFEKFYKGDKSRGSDGNGLGLSIVRRVVEMHNGTISVENREQGGTCFTVTL